MLEIAICDDDKADLNFVIEIVREIFKHNEIEYNLQAFDSAKEMLGKVKRIDIAILDISMEELNGIELASCIIQSVPEVD
jgi:DNA-binding LytR/AlgR family response regulator